MEPAEEEGAGDEQPIQGPQSQPRPPVEVVDGLWCPDCGAGSVGVKDGPGAQPFANLAARNGHRATRHGWVSDSASATKARRRRANRAPDQPDGSTAWGAIRDAAGEMSPTKEGPPSIDELNNAFARLGFTVSVAAASYIVESDPRYERASDDTIDSIVDDLAVPPDEAAKLTYPAARALGRTRINRKYGRGIVDNIEIGESLAVAVTIGLRWRRFMRGRREAILEEREARPAPIRLEQREGTLATHGTEEDGTVHTTNGSSGVLATPDLVDRIREQQGRG